GCGSEFSGADLLAAFGLHAGNLEAAVGANDGDAVGFDRNHFTERGGNSLRIARGHRLRVENLELGAVQGRPGARRGIAAADQTVEMIPRLAASCLGRTLSR